MLAEQAAQNAAKFEEAYGGFAQRASNFLVFLSPYPSIPFFFLLLPAHMDRIYFFKLQ